MQKRRGSAAVIALLAVANQRICAQAVSPAAVSPTATYDSLALATLLNDAARVNVQIPDRLRAYRARIETEMSVVVLDSGGRERSTQIEQIASDVRWRAPDRYDQRVIGYRSQSIGPTFSLMSFFGGWTVPTLYGNRLQLGVTAASDPNKTVNAARQSLAIHPLAINRDVYYQFEGGDTAVTLFSSARRTRKSGASATRFRASYVCPWVDRRRPRQKRGRFA